MPQLQRVHILSAVNAANVSKSGGTYLIKDVCGAVDDIVMNSKLYPAEQLAKGAATLEGKPAPAGHPKNEKGQAISALNGEALASAWIGSYCRNARHEGGRTLVDIVVNEAQARAHPEGLKLVERLDAAIDGTNSEPIHVSTGLYHDTITANGESRGKRYSSIAVNYRYDHLAILVDGVGAGTPADGVGLFLNEEGGEQEIEVATLNADTEDLRSKGLKAWVLRLVGNGSTEVSFDQITSALYAHLPEGAWIRDTYDRYVIWADRENRYFKQDYTVSSDGSVAFSNEPVAVERKVEYVPITNSQEVDPVKEQIVAALNKAGVKTEGLSDDQLLTAFNSLQSKELQEKLNASNSKLAELELEANAAKDAELTALATKLATNSSLTVDDLKKLGLDRLKELDTNASKKAAPVTPGATQSNNSAEDEFKDYDLNSHFEEKK